MGKRMKILNSTLEMALRFLAIMSVCGYSFSEQRLRAYSYFAIHLSDLDKTKMSAHPSLPFRFNNYIGTEKILHTALHLLITKGLLMCTSNKNGMKFAVNDLGKSCFEIITGTYKSKLIHSIKEVDIHFHDRSDNEIYACICEQLDSWGSEFSNESILNSHIYDE